MNEVMSSKLPNIQAFIEYLEEFYNYAEVTENNFISKYEQILSKFNNTKEVIEKFKEEKGVAYYVILLFISLKCKVFSHEYVKNIKIIDVEKKLMFFGIVNERFQCICQDEFRKNKNVETYFYKYLIQTLSFWNLNTIEDINIEKLHELDSDEFGGYEAKRRQYVLLLERVLQRYTLKGSKQSVRISIKHNKEEREYGTKELAIINIINEYVNETYKIKNQVGNNFKKTLKLFFKWIDEKDKGINEISKIELNYIRQYYKYVDELDVTYSRKQFRCSVVYKFLAWSIHKKYLVLGIEDIMYTLETPVVYEVEKPRMFEQRLHYIQVIEKVQKYIPIDEEEFLYKNLILAILGTGLRFSEGLKLDNTCIEKKEKVSENSCLEVGRIVVRTKDKCKVINKRTSIQPWGLKSLELLIDRFNSMDNTYIYDKEIGEYRYSLFEYKGQLISESKVKRFLDNKIWSQIEFKNFNGQVINYENIKFHAFRHQKFNDIFEITDGNIMKTNKDANHVSLRMTRKYVNQASKKFVNAIVNNIESGNIVGNGAKILKELIEINMLPNEYLDSIKKLYISEFYSIEYVVENLKFLGFGFCAGKCKWSHLCEGCKYFLTDHGYLKELKERYVINYIMTMALINKKGEIDEELGKRIVSLKRQEKILEEIGVAKEEIKDMRLGGNSI